MLLWTVRLDPIPDEPAILIDGETLVIADLHIGIEVELGKAGIFLPSQTMKMAQKVIQIIEKMDARSLVVLGDTKHFIPGTAALERRDIPYFFSSLLEFVDDVHVVAGNHDATVKPYIPGAVKFHGPGGFTIGRVGFVHGHAWPSRTVMKSTALVMGHNHPAVVLIDELGGKSIQPCWVRFRFKRKIKGHLQIPREGLLVPSFNELCGGATINDVKSRLLGPMFSGKVALLDTADIHLLDGTYLGKMKDLRVDSGLKPQDFRQ